MRRLSPEELFKVRSVLRGTRGEAIRRGVFHLSLGNFDSVPKEVLSTIEQNGWYGNGRFTEVGQLIRDPLREFGFWLQRDKNLPSEDCVPILHKHNFAGKSVLELGSGGGCNLFSLQGIPERLTGLEPMPVYLQMTPVLAELAGLAVPEVVEGIAERIPFADSSYEIIICYSSHQYMDVARALREISRVLMPGGTLIIVGNTLFSFIKESVSTFLRGFNLGRAKFNGVAILNTFAYQMFGRRVVKAGDNTTSTPIYPSRSYMRRQLRKLGLEIDIERTCRVGTGETVLVAIKH